MGLALRKALAIGCHGDQGTVLLSVNAECGSRGGRRAHLCILQEAAPLCSPLWSP